ncbi:MAG: hypothetical protein ACI86C_001771 [Candidatus Latescibacterota bacterium]|jgi:hypothetical protein
MPQNKASQLTSITALRAFIPANAGGVISLSALSNSEGENLMKYVFITMICIILASCGTVGDYYITVENDEERSHTTLYKDNNIIVHLNHFDGNSSTLTIRQRNTAESLRFKIVNVSQSLSAETVKMSSISRNDTKRLLSSNPKSSVLLKVTEVYELEIPLERATEKVVIELLINEKPISITKEFPLERVTYNQFQALMAI